MGYLAIDWNKLDDEHKRFVIRVRNGSGGKHAAEPHYQLTGEECSEGYPEQIALWEKAEASGFIECTGSYKWVTTAKFADLEKDLFGII